MICRSRLVREMVVADILQTTSPALRALRMAGTGPPFVKLGRSVRYDLNDIEKFIAENRFTSTKELKNEYGKA